MCILYAANIYFYVTLPRQVGEGGDEKQQYLVALRQYLCSDLLLREK